MCQALHIPLHHLLYAYNYVVYIKVLVYAARNQLLFEKYQTRQNTMPIYANKLLFIFALFKNSLFLYESKIWVRLSNTGLILGITAYSYCGMRWIHFMS